MKRKIVVFLVVLGLCFLPQMAASWAPPCYLVCCPAEDWDTECSVGSPYFTTTCQSWWWYEGGTCP